VISSDLLTPVTVTAKTWSNVKGQRTATTSTSTWSASVQPMRPRRVEQHGLTQGQTGYTAYGETNPAVNVGDTITWGSHTLSVLGPARDEAGRGEVFAIDCVELA
jgi:hypothetical protein